MPILTLVFKHIVYTYRLVAFVLNKSDCVLYKYNIRFTITIAKTCLFNMNNATREVVSEATLLSACLLFQARRKLALYKKIFSKTIYYYLILNNKFKDGDV